MWRIRDGVRPGEEGPRKRNLAYPHAVEHDGKLYVVYSVGFGGNRNHCELAVIPVDSLAPDDEAWEGSFRRDATSPRS